MFGLLGPQDSAHGHWPLILDPPGGRNIVLREKKMKGARFQFVVVRKQRVWEKKSPGKI